MELLEEDLISLNLGSKDDGHKRLDKKKARAKKVGKYFLLLVLKILNFKVRDKWNQLVFVPMSVLSMRDQTSGGKAGKREGFLVFNRLLSSDIFWKYNFYAQTVLQTVWKVLSHSIWLELPYLLFLLFSSSSSADILQVLYLTKANLYKGEKSHGRLEEGDQSRQKLSRRRR